MVKKKTHKPLQRAIEQDFLRPQLHIPSISFGLCIKVGIAVFTVVFITAKQIV